MGSQKMQARIKWIENVMYAGQSGSGHSVILDGPPEHGGNNLGIRPMEMLLLGLGGCSAFDVMRILIKARQPVLDCEVLLDAKRESLAPGVFTHIHVHFILTGNGLSEKHVQRAIQLSSEKYCSVSIMLSRAVEIKTDYEIREPH